MHRILALCSLPRTDPGDAKEFARVNGPITLGMIAGLHNKLPFSSQEAPGVEARRPSSMAKPKTHIKDQTRDVPGGLTPTLCGLFVLREQVDTDDPSCKKCLRAANKRTEVS